MTTPALTGHTWKKRKEKKNQDYAFQCQLAEKPSIAPGCTHMAHLHGLSPTLGSIYS